jgi:lysozyme
MPRNTNAAGLALYHEFEQGPGGGPALVPYVCPAGVLTIGWGHTGPDVREGMKITADEADRLLDIDLDEAEADVERLVTVPTNDNAFAALVSLRFNIGAAGFRKSTVLRLHNAGDWAGAAQAFAMWNKATNQAGQRVVLNGLVRRRAAEAALYMTPTADSQARDPQRTRAADVVPTPDRLAPVAKVGGTIAATATAAQQVVVQVGGVHQALVSVGINPQMAVLLLAIAAGVGIWWATRRRAG